jgi:hypothetical protein
MGNSLRQSRTQQRATSDVISAAAANAERDILDNPTGVNILKGVISSNQLKRGWCPLNKTDLCAIIVKLDGIPEDSPYAFYYNALKVKDLLQYIRVLLYAPNLSAEQKSKFLAYQPKKAFLEGRRIESFEIEEHKTGFVPVRKT